MGSLILITILAIFLERTHFMISVINMSTEYNGYGSIEGIMTKEAKAPMAYRVLVPAIVWYLEKANVTKFVQRPFVYSYVRLALIWSALYMVFLAWDINVVILVAALLPVTFLFDYWEWAVELAAIAAAMTAIPWLAFVFAPLYGLSKETAPLMAIAFYISSGNLPLSLAILAIILIVAFTVRVKVGKKKRYSKRIMLKQNYLDLKRWNKREPVLFNWINMSLVIMALIVLVVIFQVPGWIVPLLVLLSSILFGRVQETRLLAAAVPWVAVMILGWF